MGPFIFFLAVLFIIYTILNPKKKNAANAKSPKNTLTQVLKALEENKKNTGQGKTQTSLKDLLKQIENTKQNEVSVTTYDTKIENLEKIKEEVAEEETIAERKKRAKEISEGKKKSNYTTSNNYNSEYLAQDEANKNYDNAMEYEDEDFNKDYTNDSQDSKDSKDIKSKKFKKTNPYIKKNTSFKQAFIWNEILKTKY